MRQQCAAPSGGPCRARSAGRTGQRRVGQGQAQRLADHLDGGGRAQELAAAAGRAAGAAAELGGLVQRRSRRGRSGRRSIWTLPVSSPSVGGSVTPPGTSTQGRSRQAGQGHHHRRQALVAGGHAEHALARWAASGSGGATRSRRRCGRPGCRTCRACPACGRRRDRCKWPAKGTAPAVADRLGRRPHQQADLPVAGVVAQGDRRAVVGPQCRPAC